MVIRLTRHAARLLTNRFHFIADGNVARLCIQDGLAAFDWRMEDYLNVPGILGRRQSHLVSPVGIVGFQQQGIVDDDARVRVQTFKSQHRLRCMIGNQNACSVHPILLFQPLKRILVGSKKGVRYSFVSEQVGHGVTGYCYRQPFMRFWEVEFPVVNANKIRC